MKRRLAVLTCLLAALGLWLYFSVLPYCRNVAALDENPDGFVDSMIFMFVKSRTTWLNGTIGTLQVSVLGTIIGFLLSIPLVFQRVNVPGRRDTCSLRFLKNAGCGLARLYIAVIRGTPMMVQACIVYYTGFAVARALMKGASLTEVNQAWSFFAAGLITVSMNSAAYLAEVLRGGINSLDRGQMEACESLGFTRWQAMTKVIFPQAVRNSLPSIGNELVNNIKGTSVLTAIGFVELMFATGTVAGFYYKYLAAYCIAAIIYLILTLSLTGLLNFTMKKIGVSAE